MVWSYEDLHGDKSLWWLLPLVPGDGDCFYHFTYSEKEKNCPEFFGYDETGT